MTEKVVMLAALLLLFWSVHVGTMTVGQMDPAWLIFISSILGGLLFSSSQEEDLLP